MTADLVHDWTARRRSGRSRRQLMSRQPTVGSTGAVSDPAVQGGRAARDRASLADWLTPGHIAWSVRHARELVPTERIRPASEPRVLPERIDRSLLELEIEAHNGPVRLGDLLRE